MTPSALAPRRSPKDISMRRIVALAARAALVALCASLVAAPLVAQKGAGELPRPKGAVADTNDSQAYFDFGLANFEAEPHQAASAFYWASRLNPGSADALYARRAAMIMADAGLRRTFINGGKGARESKQMRMLDSLYLRALRLHPLLYRRLDRRLLTHHIVEETSRSARQSGSEVSKSEIDYYVEGWLRNAGPEFRAWIAYGDGRFDWALKNYAEALGRSKFKAGIRIERGRIFGMTGQLDSAVAEIRLALTEMRSRDTKDLVYFYDSKALFEHTIGTLLEQKDDVAGARDAYGKALEEDLSFYPAHQRLGMLALGAHDTATAMSELDLAVQIAGDEPFLRYVYGWALASIGKHEEAKTHLTKAIELEPYFALPHVVLGQVSERLGDGKGAKAAYTAFLAKSSLKEPQRAFATTRLKEVTEILESTPPKKP
jgi:tetratricopeptide (TPR) repeat protein